MGGPGGPERAVPPPLGAFPLPLHDGVVGVVAVALAATSRHVAAGGGPTLPGLRAVPLLDLGPGRVLVAAAGPAGRAAGGGELYPPGQAPRSCWEARGGGFLFLLSRRARSRGGGGT